MEQRLPESIRRWVGGREFTADTTGMSAARVICFEDMILKIEKACAESDRERAAMAWMWGRLPVPRILCAETADGVNYLLMSRVAGEMACGEIWLRRPEAMIGLLAEGLNRLWSTDTADCPLENGLESKLRAARARVESGVCDTENVQPDTYGERGFENPAALLEWLTVNRPEETPVLTHGDYCLPNVFLKDGGVSGLIDLGRAGLADRWQDIALCYRSLKRNLGRESALPMRLFAELGIEPDWEKIRYYILLDELF